MANRASEARSHAGAVGATGPDLAKAISSIAAYFPTETVGTYVAVLAIVQPESVVGRWILFGIFLVFTAIVVFFYAWKRKEATGQRVNRWALGWLLVFSLGSFTIWSAIMPWSPFLEITEDAQRYAGAAAIILAPILPMAAQVLRISPPWR